MSVRQRAALEWPEDKCSERSRKRKNSHSEVSPTKLTAAIFTTAETATTPSATISPRRLSANQGTSELNRDKQRGIQRHVKNARYQRQPCLLETPEIADTSPDPSVVTTFPGKRARKFANHQRCRQAPHNRREKQHQDGAAVARACTMSSVP